MTQLVWFRNDLRLADNPALTAACAAGEPVEACFFLTPGQWRGHDWAPAKVAFILHNLRHLGDALAKMGIPLHLRRCTDFDDIDSILLRLCRERKVGRVHFNGEYGINERRRDSRIRHRLAAIGVGGQCFPDQAAVPVGELKTFGGQPYRVFTPFARSWHHWLDAHPPALLPVPGPPGPACHPPAMPDPAGLAQIKRAFPVPPGEGAAHQRLQRFLDDRVRQYDDHRDLPAIDGTSMLSPYLACGVLSGRQCLVAARQLQMSHPGEGLKRWINEIAWRDFYIHILFHFPRVSMHRAFRPETEQLAWNPRDARFDAWKQGLTGVPLVDAAMRQLLETGWMHNRLRMVTAMFLTKNLFIDWRLGEAWFMSHLVDGFLAANNGGWQWSASTGTDAAPYFRVFNPVNQSERFDPNGDFIRRYLPELRNLDGKRIHDPAARGGRPSDYPPMIVDLKASRNEAIARFKELNPEG